LLEIYASASSGKVRHYTVPQLAWQFRGSSAVLACKVYGVTSNIEECLDSGPRYRVEFGGCKLQAGHCSSIVTESGGYDAVWVGEIYTLCVRLFHLQCPSSPRSFNYSNREDGGSQTFQNIC